MQSTLTDKEVMQQALDALTDCMDHTLGMADRANYASRAAIALRGAIAAYGSADKGMPALPVGVLIGRPHEEVWTRERVLAYGRDCFAAKDAEIAALKESGPLMERGSDGDGKPVMGTMKQILQDYRDAADAEAKEVDRLNAEIEALTRQGNTVTMPCNALKAMQGEIAALRQDAARLDFVLSFATGEESSTADKHALLLAHALSDGIDGRAAVDAAMAQAVQPQPDEQAAFEVWLAEKCPSGDVSSVQYQWASSSDYKDFLAQAVPPLNN